MSDTFRIIPYVVRSAGTDVPPEEVQAAVNSLAQQTTIALNSVASDPTGPAGGDLGGTYPNPTVVSSHITSGTMSGVAVTGGTINNAPIGQTTPAAGAFTTLTATTAVGVASGGTGQNALSAHNVLIGEGTSGVGFAAPGTAGQILASSGAAVDPSFQTKAALTIASSGANSDITSLSGLTTPLSVPQGGTGRATLTAHGVLLGEGTAAINQTSAGTAGQALVSGGAGADPAFATLGVNGGGTGATTLTAHGVLLGEGTGAIAATAVGTTGQALIGQTGADPIFGFPTGALINVQRITATGTYTPTPGTNSIVVELLGGGGAGGGTPATGAGQIAVGGGGNAGAYCLSRITSAFSGVTVTIGAAGVGSSGAAGGNGGNSSFGALMTANGGAGGAIGAGAIATPTISLASSTAATASGGNLVNANGSFGDYGESISAALNIGGKGASSQYGSGGYPGVNSAVPTAASGFGAGGAGSALNASQAAQAGSNGAAGVCIIYEYA